MCNPRYAMCPLLTPLTPESPIKNKTNLTKSKEERRRTRGKYKGAERREGWKRKEEKGKRGEGGKRVGKAERKERNDNVKRMTINCTRNTRQMSVKFNSRCCNEPLLLLPPSI
jgi:hypothetical protein